MSPKIAKKDRQGDLSISLDLDNLHTYANSLRYAADRIDEEVYHGLVSSGDVLKGFARSMTPYGPGPQGSGDTLPHIRDTYQILTTVYAGNRGAIALHSTHPGAIVHEHGGTIRPHKRRDKSGGAVRISPSNMGALAGQIGIYQVERNVIDRLDRLLIPY